METKIVKVTPPMAAAWLEVNTINRPLRRSVVDGYIAAYMRGEHRLTHQGIAFADTGELLDGQHRLSAIAEMPSHFIAEMLVTRGLPRAAFDAIDQGLKRNAGDVLHIPAGHAAVARFLAVIHETSRTGITNQFLVPFVKGTEDPYARLTGFCSTVSKTWSSASIRAAAILRIVSGSDVDYVCLNYYALIHADFDSMAPIVQALYRQHARGLINGTQGYDLFCRAYKAFDPKLQDLRTIQISDTAGIITRAREIVRENILGMKKAPNSLGAKKVNGANSTRSPGKAHA